MYNACLFNQNFNIKTEGVNYMWVYLYICGYIKKYYICGLKVGVHIILGVHYTWVFTATTEQNHRTFPNCD